MELVYLLEKILCRAVRCVAEALGTLPPAWPLWLFLFMQTISGSLLKVTGGGGKVKKKKKIQACRPPGWCSPFSLSHCLLALVLLLKVAKSRSTIPFSGFDSFVSR